MTLQDLYQKWAEEYKVERNIAREELRKTREELRNEKKKVVETIKHYDNRFKTDTEDMKNQMENLFEEYIQKFEKEKKKMEEEKKKIEKENALLKIQLEKEKKKTPVFDKDFFSQFPIEEAINIFLPEVLIRYYEPNQLFRYLSSEQLISVLDDFKWNQLKGDSTNKIILRSLLKELLFDFQGHINLSYIKETFWNQFAEEIMDILDLNEFKQQLSEDDLQKASESVLNECEKKERKYLENDNDDDDDEGSPGNLLRNYLDGGLDDDENGTKGPPRNILSMDYCPRTNEGF